MTALLTSANLPARRVEDRWLSLDEAARRSGLQIGHIRRLCQAWSEKDLAEKRKPAGGKPCWFVRESADPSFAIVKFAEQLSAEFDMSTLTADQRRQLLAKEQLVRDFSAAQSAAELAGRPKAPAVDAFLLTLRARGQKIGRTALYEWQAAYRAQGRKGLLDERWRTGTEDLPPSAYIHFFAELEHWFLDQNEKSKRMCYRLARSVASDKGWEIPSYRTACRHLMNLHKSISVRGRKGPTAFDNQVGAFIQRDYTRIVLPDGSEREMGSNDIWCGDHHQCDTIVNFNGRLARPWLTAWMDVRSRRVVGYHFFVGDPCSATILLALRNAVLNTGLSAPVYAQVDNGKDYDCYALQGVTKSERFAMRRSRIRVEHDIEMFGGVFGILGVTVMHANAYNAKSKPIERWFGTFEDQFGKLQRTYCGRSPENKPEHLEDRLATNQAPDFADYVASATAYIEQFYHQNEHSGHAMDGQSPAAAYAANLFQVRTTTAANLDIALQHTSRPIQIGRNGIKWGNLHYGVGNPELAALFGQKVRVRIHPSDVSTISVWSLDERKLCDAQANALMPWGRVSKEEWDRVGATVKRHNKAFKQVAQRGLRMVNDPMEILLEGRDAQTQAIEITGPTPSVKLIDNHLERQWNAFEGSIDRPLKRLCDQSGPEVPDLVDLTDTFTPDDSFLDKERDPFAIFAEQMNDET